MRTSYDWYYNPPWGVGQVQIDRALVLLERAGFVVDVPYLNAKAEEARSDESDQLASLRSTYRGLEVADSAKTDTEIDDLWSSSKQLDELLHLQMRLEPSPIWKKGEVATWKGERKLDGVALEYLANDNPALRPFLSSIVNLRRVRGCIKYLSKLPRFIGPDGFIHPVYGATSDDDDRGGTATGRNGMKNPECHQIPKEGEKDPYGIRRGFIAPPGQVLIVRDYSAQEVVILDWICRQLFDDDSLSRAVDPKVDFHSENALDVFGRQLGWVVPTGKGYPDEGRRVDSWGTAVFKTHPYLKKLRDDSKTVWYGAQFRKSGRGFGFTLLGPDGRPIGTAGGNAVLGGFLRVNPALQKWYDFVDEWFLTRDYMAESNGRYRQFTDLLDDPKAGRAKRGWKYRAACRKGGNMPMQGMGASMKNAAVVSVQEDSRIQKCGGVLQLEVHDELICRADEGVADEVNEYLKDDMENCYKLISCRTGGGKGKNWRDAK